MLRAGLLTFTLLSLCQAPAVAQANYRSQMNSNLSWAVRPNSLDYSAVFDYDYSADFVPEAPNSRPGDDGFRGLKLEANIAVPAASTAVVVAPLFVEFTGAYVLRFDAWMNYDVDERINGGSAGTAEFIGGGIGYDNNSSDIGAGAQILATGDGGSGSDWRVYADGEFLDPEEMAAGDRNGFNAYYSDFLPGVSPPIGQAQVSFPAGTSGSPGFQWITFEISTILGVATFHIEKPNGERLLIATFDQATRPYASDGNLSIVYADYFTSVSSRPDLTFGLIDNVELRAVLFADGFESGDTTAWSTTVP